MRRGVQGAASLVLIAAWEWTSWGQVFDPAYSLEIHKGAVVAPARIMGMGGASIGIAEGSAAQEFNPAAVANRFIYNGNRWFDYDFDYALVKSLAGRGHMDIENNGRSSSALSSAVNQVSFYLNFGRFGVGISGELSEYRVCPGVIGVGCSASEQVLITGGTAGLNLGYNFFSGQLVVGYTFYAPEVTIRDALAAESTDESDDQTATLTRERAASAVGILWRPQGLPLRVGLFGREAVNLIRSSTQISTINGVSLPLRAGTPAQIGVGVSVSLGPREYNPESKFDGSGNSDSSGDRRRYVLIAADAVYTENRNQAGSLEAWIDNQLQVVGQDPTWTFRLGAESELWSNRLKLRLGTYYEPSRVRGVSSRLHATGGAELRLFKLIWDFSTSFAVDYARNYFNSTVGVTFWH